MIGRHRSNTLLPLSIRALFRFNVAALLCPKAGELSPFIRKMVLISMQKQGAEDMEFTHITTAKNGDLFSNVS